MVAGAAMGCGRLDFGRVCTVTFCDDFDRTTPVATGWSSMAISGGAALAIDSAKAVTPPSSLLATFDASTTGTAFLSNLLAPIATTSTTLTFALDIDASDMTGHVHLADLVWNALPAPCTALTFAITRTSNAGSPVVVFEELYTGCGGTVDTTLPIADGAFHEIELDVRLDTASARVAVDGNAVVDHATLVALPQSTVRVRLGPAAINNVTAPWMVRYDDLAVDVR